MRCASHAGADESADGGFDVVNWQGIREKVLVPSLVAPYAAFFLAAALLLSITWLIPSQSCANVSNF